MARDHEEKLRSVMYLDSKKEQDLIEYIAELKHSHKLGEFIAICMRTCWENPEFLEKAGYTTEQCGMTDRRTRFFNDINRQMNDLRRKVNQVYDMALKEYSLAQFGKRIGLLEKSKNLLQSEFILRRQVEDLSRILGITNMGKTWESLADVTDSKAEELLELIIESYDGIVSEIESQQAYTSDRKAEQVEKVGKVDTTNKNISGSMASDNSNISSPSINIDLTSIKEDAEEPKEFGEGVDLGLLEQFLGF